MERHQTDQKEWKDSRQNAHWRFTPVQDRHGRQEGEHTDERVHRPCVSLEHRIEEEGSERESDKRKVDLAWPPSGQLRQITGSFNRQGQVPTPSCSDVVDPE
jgi:hypothetical protein